MTTILLAAEGLHAAVASETQELADGKWMTTVTFVADSPVVIKEVQDGLRSTYRPPGQPGA